MIKKKIAFLIPCLGPGGAERVIVTLANYFFEKYDVTLIVLFKTTIYYEISNDIPILYLDEKSVPSTSIIKAIKSNLLYLKKIVRIVKNNNIDILIGFTTPVNVLTIIASKITKGYSIISERNCPHYSEPNFFWKLMRRLSFAFADKLVVQTHLVSAFYYNYISKDKIIVIPNPINEDLISKRDEYKNRDNIILTVGRLDTNKNQRLLIEAFANLNLINWKLVIAGDGTLREEYKKLINSLDIADKVDLVGNTKNISDYYNSAKIFVFTSRSEGFPNALLEATAFGLPCISTDCLSGPSEIIKHNENGYLIEVNNKEQLEDRLKSLVNNPIRCVEISKKSLILAERFRIDKICQQWERLILKLI